ncbi:GILT family protein [Rhodotorula paludigena]|uniref:GILT family protein n=1 Tax=Rhodotorula paludigena TaxID=86838 RepID=UPI0031731014
MLALIATALLALPSALASPVQLPFHSSASPSSTRLVPVALGVMSKCPDAMLCENVWDRVLETRVGGAGGVLVPGGGGGGGGGGKEGDVPRGEVSELVSMELVYIGRENKTATHGVTCMHGDSECVGNMQQLCAAKHWTPADAASRDEGEGDELRAQLRGKQGWEDWWNFVQCMNYGDRSRIGSESAAKECAKVAKREWNDSVASCVTGKEGRHLLLSSVRRAHKLGVTKSCTVLIEDKPVCVHDGTWKECPAGHEVGDFVREVKESWVKLNVGGKAED